MKMLAKPSVLPWLGSQLQEKVFMTYVGEARIIFWYWTCYDMTLWRW